MLITHKNRKRLGDLLLEGAVITQDELDKALALQKDSGKLLGVILVETGIVTEEKILFTLQQQLNIEKVLLSGMRIPENILKIVKDVSFLKRHVCFPYKISSGVLSVAMADPLNIKVTDDLGIITGLKIQVAISSVHDIMSAIDKYYGSEQMQKLMKQLSDEDSSFGTEDTEDKKNDSDAPMIQLVNTLFEQGVHARASDIHIEALESRVRVRFRVDGDLVEQPDSYPVAFLAGVISRIKIMGNMDISEKRKPQDGRITIVVDDVEYDVRVSICPTSFGEKIVMRLTNKAGLSMEKSRLGLLPDDEKKFDNLLKNSHGIILVTGPTGSGKSTTLYTALSELNKEKVNIVTVEDPVEANIDGLNQVQVNPKAGLTFITALRSFLRQDPDIIMVGEIRDKETASIAVDASLTGHLVVSTLHTNSSISSISRLEKMGIESYLLADAIVGIIAQRLVKRLCDCKKPHVLTSADRRKLGLKRGEDATVYETCGCLKCNNSGYAGRIGVYEILVFTDDLKEAVADEKSFSELEAIALKNGLSTLKMSARRLILNGITTIDEMERIVHESKVEEECED